MSDAKNKDRPETFLDSSNPEELHRFLFEEAADGMFIADPQRRFVAVNPRGTELTGYALEELLGTAITDLVPPEDLVRDPVRMDDLRQGKIVLKERRIRRKDGSLLPVEISTRMLPAGNIIGIVRDITERQRAEMQLQESADKYRRLIETTGTGYVIIDDSGRVIDANQEYVRLTGRQELEDVVGHSVLEWTAPHDLERNASEVRKCIEQSFVRHLELDYVTPIGRVIPVEINATVLSDPGTLRILALCRDISARKKAGEKLRANENLLSSIFRATPIGIGVVSNRRLLAVNDRICEMIGCTAEDLIGKSARVLYPSDADFEYVGAEKYRQIADRGTGTVETRWQCKDGRLIDVLLSSTPINPLDMAGEVTFTALDITERKRSADALRQANLVIEKSPVVLFRWKATEGWPVVMVSQNVIQFGYTPEELLSGAVPFAAMVHPEDLDRVAREVQEYSASGADRFQQEYRIVTKDGGVRYVDDRTVVERNVDGQIAFFQGIAIDITERKRAEEALFHSHELMRYIIEHNRSAIAVHDRNLRYIYVSQRYLDDYKVKERDVIGKHHYDVFPDLPQKWRDVHQKALVGEVSSAEDDPYVREDGSVDWTRWECRPWHEADGSIGGIIIYTEIITERKRAEAEKDALQAQLRQAQKMESVGRLAGGVAHDFNNMLSAILGHTELAIMQCTPSEPLQDDLKAIQQAALRSADLVRQLLAFARRQTVAPKVLDLNDTVSGMLKMLLRLIGEDIDLVWVPGAGLWSVKMDPSQIDQLLANLCVNARDAIAGVGKVTIKTENIALDEAYCAVHPGFACGEYAMLAVSDDGCGMTQEVLDHLFEPFFTTKEVGTGTGLGLAMVYGIVTQNEGFINVYSEPDKGTTFKIYLPRFVGDAVEPMAESHAETPMGSGETVLLVEDEAVILDVTRAMLERLGYTVLTADTPSAALRQAKAHASEIQLLMSDVVMPEMNGRDLSKLIRAIKPGLKCLFTSGYTANVIAQRGVLEEGVHFLQKPFSMKDLASMVHQALER